MQIESHVKRLDEDLNQFAEDLKQGISVICYLDYVVPDLYYLLRLVCSSNL